MGNIQLPETGAKPGPTSSSTVSFEEAQSVFLDENARLITDPDHSANEDRFLLLGYSFQSRCLILSHCYRESDTLVRLISAGRATAREEGEVSDEKRA